MQHKKPTPALLEYPGQGLIVASAIIYGRRERKIYQGYSKDYCRKNFRKFLQTLTD
jgi:hypothetical protein